ncbi:hypothetical protein Tco_0258671, partial [Tanacetum coccineum]
WEDIAYQIDHRYGRKSQGVRICHILDSQRMGEDVQQYGLTIPATMLNKEIIQSESYKRFILYSTGQIPPKKSRGKEPLIRRKTSSRRVGKKKATISVDDNIIPEPGITLELGKSISLTEAEEEAAARQVHATHASLVR